MMKYLTFFAVLLVGLAANSSVYSQDKQVTLESLLNEMIDRVETAQYPDPYYTTRQFSSYDRNSEQPGDSTWFANWDRTQFIRTEQNKGRKEYVMLETEGPGAIVRFWMTFAGEGGGEGTLRIYFDGEKQPTIEGSAFDVLSGGLLVNHPLSASVSTKTDYEIRGHNLYLPLPFSGKCKITYESENIESIGAKEGGESVYYNINYREYEHGTKVETFTYDELDKIEKQLQQVQKKLKQRDKEAELEKLDTELRSFSETLSNGDSHRIMINGPAAIRKLTANLQAENEKQALRSTVLDISFDGNRTVWVPMGDFFGTGYQYRKSDTWYTSVSEDGQLSAYWIMPFNEKAEITFHNLGDQEVHLEGAFETSDWDWNEQSMYLGASWHQYTDLKTGEQKDMQGSGGPFDINYTHLKGQGVYVGDVLTLFNTAYAWWGEGDEKIYVDGEDFPSHFGTGTEDYYGYAWVRPESFTNHPFISQPDGSGNITPGYTVNQRFRALDVIPFKKELTFDMEMWHWTKTVIDYAPTSFFYLRPGGNILVDADRENAMEPVSLKRSDIISPNIKEGKIEGEKMIVESVSGGNIKFQFLENPSLSNDKQLWWRDADLGDTLTTAFISDKAGIFRAEGGFVVAPDYGEVSISLNGQTIMKKFDVHSDSLSTKIQELGSVNIRKGRNEIQVHIIDKSPATGDAMFGLDFIQFENLSSK